MGTPRCSLHLLKFRDVLLEHIGKRLFISKSLNVQLVAAKQRRSEIEIAYTG